MIGTVIVTGASRGIGAAIVRSLRVKNVRVIGVARSELPLKALAAEKIGPGAMVPIIGDVCSEDTLKSAVQAATSDAKAPLRGVILNAATPIPFGRIGDVDLKEWSEAVNTNVLSQLRLIQLALPYLRKTREGLFLYLRVLPRCPSPDGPHIARTSLSIYCTF